jgi:hypothetical protein
LGSPVGLVDAIDGVLADHLVTLGDGTRYGRTHGLVRGLVGEQRVHDFAWDPPAAELGDVGIGSGRVLGSQVVGAPAPGDAGAHDAPATGPPPPSRSRAQINPRGGGRRIIVGDRSRARWR